MRRPFLSRRHTAVVVAAATSAMLLSGCEAYDLPLPGSPVDDDNSFEVTAEFADVLNLVPRSPVKVNDVTVGEVVELERKGWNATAVLRLQDDVELPDSVFADIRQTSLLGEKYVALEPDPEEPETGRLEDGDTIELSSTGRNPELEEVLAALSAILNGGGVGQLKTITTELNKVFDGRRDRVRHVLGELRTLMSGLDEQREDILGAMEAMNGLARTLNQEKRTVTEALDAFGPAVSVLADQHEELMRMLRALDRLGKVGTRVVNATKEDLLTALRHLRPVLREIARADDQIPTALGLLISFPFPIESNDIVHGDYANTSIVFSIDLNNFFASLGPGGGGGGGDGGDGGGLPELPGLPEAPSLPDVPGTPGGGGAGGGGGGDNGGGGGLPGVPGLPGVGNNASHAGYATSMSELLGGARR